MRGLLALLLLAAASQGALSAPWWLLAVFIPVLLVSGRLPGSSRYRVPATTGQDGDCPACGGEWRDVPRHLVFAHGETVVGVLP